VYQVSKKPKLTIHHPTYRRKTMGQFSLSYHKKLAKPGNARPPKVMVKVSADQAFEECAGARPPFQKAFYLDLPPNTFFDIEEFSSRVKKHFSKVRGKEIIINKISYDLRAAVLFIWFT
jgi:hypothetical protein